MNGLAILYNFLFFIFTSVLSKQQLSHTKISPGISLEGMMLKLKLQCFGHFMWRVDSLEDFDAGRDWGQEEKRTPEDEMAGWHHWLDGRESEWTPGVGDGQGGLAGCDSWDRKESDTTERLNWTELKGAEEFEGAKSEWVVASLTPSYSEEIPYIQYYGFH